MNFRPKTKTYDEAILENRLRLAETHEEKKEEKPIAVIAALAADIIIAIVKFIAAAITGSSAMVSEGIHSLVDTSDALLVFYGLRVSKRSPDIAHPFGYGKQVYFYCFVVSLCILTMGGGASLIKGIQSMIQANTTVLGDPTLNYIVCIIAMFVEGTALTVTIRTINKERGEMNIFSYVHNSKDPSNFVMLLEDSTAEVGLIAAIAGVALSHVTGNPRFDAASSIFIGVLLIAIAVVVFKETKGLLIGEGLSLPESEAVIDIVESEDCVNECGRVLSMYMGPDDLMLAIDVNFKENTTEAQLMKATDNIENNIKRIYPEASRIFIEVEGLDEVNKQWKKFEQITEKESK